MAFDRSHAPRGNAAGDAPRHLNAERPLRHYHAERGNDHTNRVACITTASQPNGGKPPRHRGTRFGSLVTDRQNTRLIRPDKHIEIADFVLFQLHLLSQRRTCQLFKSSLFFA